MDNTSFQLPDETSWRHPWSQCLSPTHGKCDFMFIIQPESTHFSLLPHWSKPLSSLTYYHCTSCLAESLLKSLSHFSGQSYPAKTWVWSCYFSTQSCAIASHLRQDEIQKFFYNSQHGPYNLLPSGRSSLRSPYPSAALVCLFQLFVLLTLP